LVALEKKRAKAMTPHLVLNSQRIFQCIQESYRPENKTEQHFLDVFVARELEDKCIDAA